MSDRGREPEQGPTRSELFRLRAENERLRNESFESLTGRMMAAATREGHSVNMKVKYDVLPVQEADSNE